MVELVRNVFQMGCHCVHNTKKTAQRCSVGLSIGVCYAAFMARMLLDSNNQYVWHKIGMNSNYMQPFNMHGLINKLGFEPVS